MSRHHHRDMPPIDTRTIRLMPNKMKRELRRRGELDKNKNNKRRTI